MREYWFSMETYHIPHSRIHNAMFLMFYAEQFVELAGLQQKNNKENSHTYL